MLRLAPAQRSRMGMRDHGHTKYFEIQQSKGHPLFLLLLQVGPCTQGYFGFLPKKQWKSLEAWRYHPHAKYPKRIALHVP